MADASQKLNKALARKALLSGLTILGTVACCTVLAALASVFLDHENLILIFFVGISFIATRHGLVECVIACILSVISFDFFIVPPLYSFLPQDPQYVVTFAAMLAFSVVLSAVVTRHGRALDLMRHQAELIDLTSDAIIEWEVVSLRIIFWNSGAERLFAIPSQAAIGTNLPDLLKADYPLTFEELINNLKSQGACNGETTYHLPGKPPLIVASRWSYKAGDDEKPATITEFATDVSERKIAETRVKEFYSMVSHELRTPLTSIKGCLQLLENNVVEPASEEGAEMLTLARTQADLLAALINDILDLQKIESGKFELSLSKVAVDDVIDTVIENLAVTANSSHILLIKESHSDCLVEADPIRLVQVLTNLVANAIKFSPVNRPVVISTASDHDRLRVSVKDLGPGIAKTQLPKLFGKFQQLDSSDTRVHGGTGLGLAISKAIIEQHGGIIGVITEVGEGSTFWFELEAVAAPSVSI